MSAARILIVDDHQIMRDGLRLLLAGHAEWTVVGSAVTCAAAWAQVGELKPDLVIMDLDLPGEGGVALTARILKAHSGTKVLVLTGSADPRSVRSALAAGASGYLLKTNAGDMLVLALRAVLAGQVFLCPDVSTVVVHELQRQQSHASGAGALSVREREILARIANGQTTKEIAFALELSPKTVETHRLNLMAKIGVTSVAGLTKHALREGLTTL